MADYLACQNATQRARNIRAAKFPKKIEVAAYNQIRRPLRDALSQPGFARDDLDFLVAKLDTKAEREVGYNRDEAMRCARAVRAFQDTFNPKAFARCEVTPAPSALFTRIEGVKINLTLDATVTETKGDETRAGGIIILYAFSADRSGVKDRLSTAAGLMLWVLEGGQMEPLPRLCMAADIAGKDIQKASASHSRFRESIVNSCREVAAGWDNVEPPSDYDGQAWN